MKQPDSPAYVLTLNSDQANAVLTAVELMMRTKLNQPGWILEQMLDWNDPEFDRKSDEGRALLQKAFDVMFRGIDPTAYKDAEWYRLYNLYQVLRKAIHDAEFPDAGGVWSYDPVQLTAEPLPKIEWSVKS